MYIVPKFHFEPYEPEGKIWIGNLLQAIRYWQHGAQLYDIVPDGDRWLYVFDSKEVKSLFDLWCRRDLPQKERDN